MRSRGAARRVTPNGTLFAINANSSAFSVLHSFTGNPHYTNSDGVWPSGVMLAGTTLYGTAEYGGATGSGTMFSVTLSNPTPPTLLIPMGYSSTNGFQFLVTNGDGTAITASEQSRVEIYATTNLGQALTNWTLLTNPPVLGNGVLEIQDQSSLPERFYRSAVGP